MKKVFFSLIFIICSINIFAVESIYSRPGSCINIIIETVNLQLAFKRAFPNQRINLSDTTRYRRINFEGEILYLDLSASDEGVRYFYNSNGDLDFIQADVVGRISELIYGMAIVGYIYREFNDYYFFPSVGIGNGFSINLYILKSGHLSYYIVYDE